MSVRVSAIPARIAADLRSALTRPASLALAAIYLAGSVSAVAFFPSEASMRGRAARQPALTVAQDARSDFERWWATQPRTTLPVPGGNAAVVVVTFSDMQ